MFHAFFLAGLFAATALILYYVTPNAYKSIAVLPGVAALLLILCWLKVRSIEHIIVSIDYLFAPIWIIFHSPTINLPGLLPEKQFYTTAKKTMWKNWWFVWKHKHVDIHEFWRQSLQPSTENTWPRLQSWIRIEEVSGEMQIFEGDDKCAQKWKSEFSTVPIPHDNLRPIIYKHTVWTNVIL